VPCCGEHGVFDGDKGSHWSASGGDSSVFGGEVGVVRPCYGESGNAECAFEVAVARAGFGGLDPSG
jgi:hypothetical protein